MNKGVKITISHAFAEGFISLVDTLLKQPFETDDDKLLAACLVELRHRFWMRIEKMQKEYSLTLTPAQALACRILYTDYIMEPTSYMGAKLLLIANEVQKQYAA